MKTLILDGFHAIEPQAAHTRNGLGNQLPETEIITLREQKISNCTSDFLC